MRKALRMVCVSRLLDIALLQHMHTRAAASARGAEGFVDVKGCSASPL